MRVIVEFAKEGAAAYVSHLDLLRVMQRALRRANVPIAYSQGFNPHGLLSFATAVPTGSSSRCEIMDMQLEREMEPGAILEALNGVLPGGLRALRAKAISQEAPAPMATVEAARYVAIAPGGCAAACREFLAKKEVLAVKRGKKGDREVDIRPMVYALIAEESAGSTQLSCTLRHDSGLALKPDLLLGALGVERADVLRTALLVRRDGDYGSLYDFLQ